MKSRISNDVETIVQVLKKLKSWLKPDSPIDDPDPMEKLKKILQKENKEKLNFEVVPEIKEHTVSNIDNKGNVTFLAEGFTRKHVPYVKNGKAVAQLVSKKVTK